jgi:hypothetical protein
MRRQIGWFWLGLVAVSVLSVYLIWSASMCQHPYYRTFIKSNVWPQRGCIKMRWRRQAFCGHNDAPQKELLRKNSFIDPINGINFLQRSMSKYITISANNKGKNIHTDNHHHHPPHTHTHTHTDKHTEGLNVRRNYQFLCLIQKYLNALLFTGITNSLIRNPFKAMNLTSCSKHWP